MLFEKPKTEDDTTAGDLIAPETSDSSVERSLHNGSELNIDDEMPDGKVMNMVEPASDDLLLPEELKLTEEDDYSVSKNTEAIESIEPIDTSELKVRRVAAAEGSEKADTEPRGFLFALLDTLKFVCMGLLIGILLVVFVVQRNDVLGISMEPTLHDNDAVFVEMISVYLKSFERGDIVTIEAEGMEGYGGTEKIIKRIVGLPGETISFTDGYVYINGVILSEPYLTTGLMTYISTEGVNKGYDNITLGEDEYFCLGDNRGSSLDSRVLGPIPLSRIKSHVLARIYPFDQMKFYGF